MQREQTVEMGVALLEYCLPLAFARLLVARILGHGQLPAGMRKWVALVGNRTLDDLQSPRELLMQPGQLAIHLEGLGVVAAVLCEHDKSPHAGADVMQIRQPRAYC